MVAYLRARYDEEEADARTVQQRDGDELWVLDPQYDHHDHTRVLWISPAHVLADLNAKRAIVAMYEEALTTHAYRKRLGAGPHTELVIRVMLQPYAALTDFDPRWKL
jgi:hypothetical protein